MIDIHTHILPFLDDGSDSIATSVELVRTAWEQGVTDLFCTPHYRHKYKAKAEKLTEKFELLKQAVIDAQIPVNLYLGQEIYLTTDIKNQLKENKVLTLNNTNYVLCEFEFSNVCDIPSAVHELVTAGYIPIVAHLERYDYVSLYDAMEIKEFGGLIQVNADCLVGAGKRKNWKFVKGLFKNGLVDFVASDMHRDRHNYMAESAKVVKRKFGENCCQAVYQLNAQKIIEG